MVVHSCAASHSGVPIIGAGDGGEYGGQATADVLAGDYNPGGASTLTWYPQAFAEQTRSEPHHTASCTHHAHTALSLSPQKALH